MISIINPNNTIQPFIKKLFAVSWSYEELSYVM